MGLEEEVEQAALGQVDLAALEFPTKWPQHREGDVELALVAPDQVDCVAGGIASSPYPVDPAQVRLEHGVKDRDESRTLLVQDLRLTCEPDAWSLAVVPLTRTPAVAPLVTLVVPAASAPCAQPAVSAPMPARAPRNEAARPNDERAV